MQMNIAYHGPLHLSAMRKAYESEWISKADPEFITEGVALGLFMASLNVQKRV